MKAKRLKKNPEIADYVVEVSTPGKNTSFFYFITRKDARLHAKESMGRGAVRVRIFHCKFTLVSDSKPRAKK